MQLFRMAYLIVFAMLLGGHTTRSVPGGPFLSLTGDIVPAALSIIAIWLGFAVLQCGKPSMMIAAYILIILASIALGLICVDVLEFWLLPHARGPLMRP